MFEFLLRDGSRFQIQANDLRNAKKLIRREFKVALGEIEIITKIY